MIISVDNGNAYTKTSHTSFVSGVVKLDSKPIAMGEVIYYDGSYYSLSNKRLTYMKNKTVNENLLILTLFAISKELILRNSVNKKNKIDLALGLPPGHYAIVKSDFEKYFSEKIKNIVYEYNGITFSLEVDNIFVFPQSFSAVSTRKKDLEKYSRSYVIDIGGYTVDTLMLAKGVPDISYVETLELGIIKMYNDIKRKASVKYDIKIEESDIEELIRGNAYSNILYDNKFIREIIDEEANRHTNEIINQLRERGIDLKASYAIFIGGGSILLERYLRKNKQTSKMEIINDTKANARGYESLAKRMLEVR